MEARSPAYIAVLAVVAGSILMVGSLMKPAADDSDTGNLPQAEIIPPLMLLTQRGSLEDMAEYFARSASDASRHLVFLENPRQTGIVWDETGAVTTSNQEHYFPAQVEAVSSTGARLTLKATRPPPEAPVVALRPVSGIAGNPALHLRALFLTHGEWLVVTWLSDPLARSFKPGLYLGSRVVECGGRPVREISLSVTPTREMAGGGVFDFDGSLIGLVALCDGRYAALVPESVDEIVAWSSRFEGRLLARYGLRVSVLDGNEQEYFAGDETVLIREVWRGLPADTAGLRPGDLIVTFDGRPAKTPDDLQPLVLPAARELLELRVRRGRRTVTAVLPARSRRHSGSSAKDSSHWRKFSCLSNRLLTFEVSATCCARFSGSSIRGRIFFSYRGHHSTRSTSRASKCTSGARWFLMLRGPTALRMSESRFARTRAKSLRASVGGGFSKIRSSPFRSTEMPTPRWGGS